MDVLIRTGIPGNERWGRLLGSGRRGGGRLGRMRDPSYHRPQTGGTLRHTRPHCPAFESSITRHFIIASSMTLLQTRVSIKQLIFFGCILFYIRIFVEGKRGMDLDQSSSPQLHKKKRVEITHILIKKKKEVNNFTKSVFIKDSVPLTFGSLY